MSRKQWKGSSCWTFGRWSSFSRQQRGRLGRLALVAPRRWRAGVRPVVQVAALQVCFRSQLDFLHKTQRTEKKSKTFLFFFFLLSCYWTKQIRGGSNGRNGTKRDVTLGSSRAGERMRGDEARYLEISDVGEEEADEGAGQRPLGHGADEMSRVALTGTTRERKRWRAANAHFNVQEGETWGRLTVSPGVQCSFWVMSVPHRLVYMMTDDTNTEAPLRLTRFRAARRSDGNSDAMTPRWAQKRTFLTLLGE